MGKAIPFSRVLFLVNTFFNWEILYKYFGFDKGIAESADFGHAGIGQAFFDYFLQAHFA